LKNPDISKKEDQLKEFTFDNVFGTDSKQADIYKVVAEPIVEAVLQGYNGTLST
jgi:hypothetical protein